MSIGTIGGTSMYGVSNDGLLAFFESEAGGIDGEINSQMKSQESQLRQREAVESAQSALEQFGTDGPQTPDQMKQCVDAINNAIAQLPEGDPVAGQLASFRDSITSKYGYTAAQPLTTDEQARLTQDQKIVAQGPPVPVNGQPVSDALRNQYSLAQQDITNLTDKQSGTLSKKPDGSHKEWQGDTDQLQSISGDIKDNAQLDLLKLQDLVSQEQQQTQLTNGVMGKRDQTLEDLAKAIRG